MRTVILREELLRQRTITASTRVRDIWPQRPDLYTLRRATKPNARFEARVWKERGMKCMTRIVSATIYALLGALIFQIPSRAQSGSVQTPPVADAHFAFGGNAAEIP